MNQEQCHTLAQSFLDHLFSDLKEKHISFPDHWDIDHLCYRASTAESYELLKGEFQQFAKLLIESEVNGRMISTFKLEQPIIYHDWMIDLIELPAPKKGKVTAEGFEHIEVVCDWAFDTIKNHFSQCTFDEKGLSKDFNQELELVLGDRNVKFHHLSLESVVTLEGHEMAWKALKDSGILTTFKQFHPLVTGSVPLNLKSNTSSLIILMSCSDLSQIEGALKSHGLKTSRGETTLISSFPHQGVQIDIRAQALFTLHQDDYKNFQIEERLLKYGGEGLRQRLKESMMSVINTEEAFSIALGQKLQSFSRKELNQLFLQ